MRITNRVRRVGAIAAAGAVGVGAFAAGNQMAGAEDEGVPAPVQALCELVTQSEAEAALGHEVVVSDSGRLCAYTVKDPQHFGSLSVMPGPESVTPENFRSGMAAYAEAANTELREVEGVGDAGLATVGDQASQMIAHQGERFVTILLINVKTPIAERLATLAELGRTALARMR